MSYTPNNIYVFTSAYAGAVGGLLGFGKTPTNPDEEIYALACETAGAFAQAVDGLWSGTPDWLDTQILQSLCQSEWLGKNVPSSVPPVSAFASAAAGIVAILEASEVYFDSEGIEPPAIPGEATIEITLTGDVIGTGPADDVVTQAIQLQSFAGPQTPPENGSWSQATWFIDERNVTGLASNSNSGLTETAPILTKSELFRRWGTYSPYIDISVLVTFISLAEYPAQASDPWMAVPICGPAGLVTLVSYFSSLAPTFVGTLNAVTPKVNNAVPGNPLSSTFTTTSGAITQGALLVNTTRGNSTAFAVELPSGDNWTLSQPFEPYVVGSGAPPFYGLEVNTWASGDAIEGYTLPQIDIGACGASVPDNGYSLLYENAITGFVVNRLWIQGASLLDTFYDTMETGGDGAYFAECFVTKGCNLKSAGTDANGWGLGVRFYNTFIVNNLLTGTALIQGGVIQSTGRLRDSAFLDDCIAWIDTTGSQGPLCSNTKYGMVCVVGTLNLEGATEPVDTDYNLGTFYGPGIVNQESGILRYLTPATSNLFAVMNLTGQATGYSLSTAAGVTTIHGGIALTAANLVAAAGAAGFGGTATNLAGAAITNA